MLAAAATLGYSACSTDARGGEGAGWCAPAARGCGAKDRSPLMSAMMPTVAAVLDSFYTGDGAPVA